MCPYFELNVRLLHSASNQVYTVKQFVDPVFINQAHLLEN
jgi:hypothetical protein